MNKTLLRNMFFELNNLDMQFAHLLKGLNDEHDKAVLENAHLQLLADQATLIQHVETLYSQFLDVKKSVEHLEKVK